MLSTYAWRVLPAAIALVLFGFAKATTGYPATAPTNLRFAELPLAAAETPADRNVRPVNPRYEAIRGWISAVGAGVAVGDIDGDGKTNDICLVETRDDSVRVQPAEPGSTRYPAFRLAPQVADYPAGTVAPMGCLPGDFDEDGTTDLLVYYWGRPPVIFYAKPGSMAQADFRPVSLLAAHEAWYTNAAIQTDVDGDGHVDLVFGNYFPNDARVLDASATSGGVMQHSMSRAFNAGANKLFLSDRSGAVPSGFVDHSAAFDREMGNGWTLALAAADLDGDLLPEIYVANDFGPDRMLVNLSRPGDPQFRLAKGSRDLMTPRSRTLGRDSFKGMGAEFADLNGDGRLDLAVSNIAQEYALFESHYLFINGGRTDQLKKGYADFTDVSGARGIARSGWGWDIKAADLDNDGKPEIVQALGFLSGKHDHWPELQELAIANDDLLAHPGVWGRFSGDADLSGHQRNRLYAQDDRGVFHDVGSSAGFGRTGVTRGVAIADVNDDGLPDIALARQWGQSELMVNTTKSANKYIALDLRLPNANGSSRPAIGALVRILRDGQPPMIGFVDGGNGHSGKSAPTVQFGLGAWALPVTVEVEWRDPAGRHRARSTLAPGKHRIILGSRRTA
ncbi:CRTAC1 family protein [Sphingomonas sp. MMS12-HWE2-04]|uniref:CRTAC1 family protein n=1 Tax=Sphingomonas sp. MMS12-HWE2-04 TaxID=3234199 RepID=UPI00384ADA35